jgi:hypothetical protein
MARRPGNKVVTVERPRQKGWWGSPESDEVEAAREEPVAAQREPVRRVQRERPVHQPITTVGRSLTPNQVEAIRAVMHLFVDDDLGRGLDPRASLQCDRCERPQPAAGSVRYERHTFCNPCSTEFEIARARGLVEQSAEFLERSAESARSA